MAKCDVVAYARAQIEKSNDCGAVERVLSFLARKGGEDVVCLACSGGSDSIFLVKHVLEKFPGLRLRAVILHFNHALRGEDSDGDEEFVKIFARNNGVAFRSERLKNHPRNISEGTLRSCREEFFTRAMEALHSKVLLLGHQKDDVAETLLMRMLRASGTDGLSAPRALTIFKNFRVKLRPLLNFTKEDIKTRLRASHVEWRTDGSNFENDFLRNKIRNFILPQLQNAAGGIDVFSNLMAAKKNIEEADDAVAFVAGEWLRGKNLNGSLEITGLESLPAAVSKKIFAKFLSANSIEVRGSLLAALLKKMAMIECGSFSVGKGKFVDFDGKNFCIVEKNACSDWEVKNLQAGENRLPNGRTLRLEIVKISEDLWNGICRIDVGARCYAAVGEDAKVEARSYRANYAYVRFGHVSARKLGDIIGEKIVPRADRKSLPVFFVNQKACWIPGLPVSNLFKIKEMGERALLLTYL
ncbi:MAG: tRNA lysidine(34) synthetase TilS [Puniceicoccales bacterium]|jgi:tRNA(Ile)-lysidine synthase|nr:tRNA lysidine(34) synthetase TilS [Puniceicoccales bacterium]